MCKDLNLDLRIEKSKLRRENFLSNNMETGPKKG